MAQSEPYISRLCLLDERLIFEDISSYNLCSPRFDLDSNISVRNELNGDILRGYILRNSGDYHLVFPENISHLLVLTIGGGGGGSASHRVHSFVRSGAGGSSGQIISNIVMTQDYPYASDENAKYIRIRADIGAGGSNGDSKACFINNNTVRDLESYYNDTMYNGESGGNTEVEIWRVNNYISAYNFGSMVAMGGDPGLDPLFPYGTTCYGNCEVSGFTLSTPALGGQGSFNSVSGLDGIANFEISPGRSSVPPALGGSFAEHALGRGGNGGEYNATIGRVTNPSGSSYAPQDNRPGDCSDHPEANGEPGLSGAVILVPLPREADHRESLIASVESIYYNDISHSNYSMNEIDIIQDIFNYTSQIDENSDIFNNTRKSISDEDVNGAIYNFRMESLELYQEDPDLLNEYQSAAIPIWLGYFVEGAISLLLWENYPSDRPAYDELLQEDFAGWNIDMLTEESISMSKIIDAYNRILENPQAIEDFSNEQLSLLRDGINKYKARRESTERELRARYIHSKKAEISSSRANLGLAGAEDPSIGVYQEDINQFINRFRGQPKCITTYISGPHGVTTGRQCFQPY